MSLQSIQRQKQRLGNNPKPYQKGKYTQREQATLKNNVKHRPVKIFFPMNKETVAKLIEDNSKKPQRAKDLMAQELFKRQMSKPPTTPQEAYTKMVMEGEVVIPHPTSHIPHPAV